MIKKVKTLDERLNKLEVVIPLSCIFLSIMVLSPLGVNALPVSSVVFIHVLCYLSLGLCFELPELSLNTLCLLWARRQNHFESRKAQVNKILKVRYVLTHFIGPCTGILAVASGLYLTFLKGHSFKRGWLFWILIAAIIGLYKGMCQHNAYVKSLLKISQETDTESHARLRLRILNPFNQVLIFLEFPTYVFIYWAASAKPLWHSPLAGFLGRLEESGSAWTTGALTIAAGSLLLIPLRFGMRRFGGYGEKFYG